MSYAARRNLFQQAYGRILLVTLLLTLPAMLWGQGYFGTVTGMVTDPTGAVLPGAKVTLTDQEKGYQFTAVTDGAGHYFYRAVPPGLYSVTAEMAGFEKTMRTGVRVSVSENATSNLSLKIASTVQTVEVEAQTQLIATEDATTGQVINRKFINDLPMLDRDAMDLAYLSPGVTDVDNSGGNSTGTNFISNGSRNATADILMDGTTVTNFEPNGGIIQATYLPSAEAIQEFKVQQSNFSAEYGFSGASIVNMVTRSGSNTFHGSGYDFLRNQVMDANNWFNNLYGIPLPGLRRNNYGGTIGGPIFKNKTFFFLNYDGTRQTSMSTEQAGVPSAAERAGDFGEICAAQQDDNGVSGAFDENGICSAEGKPLVQGQVYDPYTGSYDATAGGRTGTTAIPYNNIAQYSSPGNINLNNTPYQLSGGAGNLIDPVAQRLMNLYPQPLANMQGGYIYKNWTASVPFYWYDDKLDLKVDHRFSENNLLSAKYSQEWNHGVNGNCFGNFADPCNSGAGLNLNHIHVFTATDTQTFNPTLLLTTTFGFTRGMERIDAYNSGNGVTDPLSKVGFPSYLGTTGGWNGLPAINVGSGYYSAGQGGISIGTNPTGNYREGQDTGQLTVVLNKQLHSQELKFGFEGRLHQMNYIQTNAPVGTFNFDMNGSANCPNDPTTCGGDGFASFLMGQPSSGGYEIQFEPATENYQYAWYAQDNWKLNNKLTLNLGLRYDVTMPRTDRHNRQNWFDPKAVSPLGNLGLLGGEVFASSKQRTVEDTDWKDIQPRFGFAYQFILNWVLRGGYGMYYSQTRVGANGVGSYGTQGFSEYTNLITTYGNDGSTPWLHLSNPYPDGIMAAPGNSLGLMNDVGFNAVGPLRGVTNTPYAQTWTLGIEHQLPWKLLLNTEYVGKKGTHLYFGGDNALNILGPEIENYSANEVGAILNTKVTNNLAPYITNSLSTLSKPKVTAWQAFDQPVHVPFPQFTSVTTDVPPIANSTYHSLQLTAEKNYSNGLQLLVSYVWSKSIDDSSVDDDNITWLGSALSLQDPNKPWKERSLSTFDIPYVLQFSYSYDLPVGHGKTFLSHMPGVLDAVVGGWKTNGVWRFSDGLPLQMTTSDGTALPTYGAQRPNLVGKTKRASKSQWVQTGSANVQGYFTNPNAFKTPDIYKLGNTPRATALLRTPSSWNANLSMEKNFSLERLRKGMDMEVRIEAQNAFNHPIFGVPDLSVDDPSFGQISSTANGPREVQIGAKISF
jgi:hypothetical protein